MPAGCVEPFPIAITLSRSAATASLKSSVIMSAIAGLASEASSRLMYVIALMLRTVHVS